MEVNEIPVEQIALDLGFRFNHRDFRYELGEFKVVIAGSKVWKGAASKNLFKSFSGPDLTGRGAISFVSKYFGITNREAVEYLKTEYRITTSSWKPQPRVVEKNGCVEANGIKYLRGTARIKRVVVLVDAEWYNEIMVAQQYPWARNAWLAKTKIIREGLCEFKSEVDGEGKFPVIVSVIPENRTDLLWEVLRRSRRDHGSVHAVNTGEAISILRNGANEFCPVYLYSLDEPRFIQPPPNDERLWSEVRDYLTLERGIEPSVVDDCQQRGYLYSTRGWWEEDGEKNRFIDMGAAAVFVTRTEKGKATGAVVRGTQRCRLKIKKRMIAGMDRNAGFFWRYVKGEDKDAVPLFVIVESPIEALSLESLAILEGRPYSNTLFGAKSGEGCDRPFLQRIAKVLELGGNVVVSFNADEKSAGEKMMRKLAAPFAREIAEGRVRLRIPKSENDWNDVLVKRRLR